MGQRAATDLARSSTAASVEIWMTVLFTGTFDDVFSGMPRSPDAFPQLTARRDRDGARLVPNPPLPRSEPLWLASGGPRPVPPPPPPLPRSEPLWLASGGPRPVNRSRLRGAA